MVATCVRLWRADSSTDDGDVEAAVESREVVRREWREDWDEVSREEIQSSTPEVRLTWGVRQRTTCTAVNRVTHGMR